MRSEFISVASWSHTFLEAANDEKGDPHRSERVSEWENDGIRIRVQYGDTEGLRGRRHAASLHRGESAYSSYLHVFPAHGVPPRTLRVARHARSSARRQ